MADIKVLPQVSAFLAQEHGQFIDGQLIPAAGGQRLPVVNPANGQTIASVGVPRPMKWSWRCNRLTGR
jgi:phenylacetaldehyde dehydrogenase